LQKLLAQEQARFEQMHREFMNWFTPLLQQQLRARFDSLLAGSARVDQDSVEQAQKSAAAEAAGKPPRKMAPSVRKRERARGKKSG
jgi:hypothetical protein